MLGQRHQRPYRSHSRPACIPCKRRRSRCKVDRGQNVCLLCKVHNTENECSFPSSSATTPKKEALHVRQSLPELPEHEPAAAGPLQPSSTAISNWSPNKCDPHDELQVAPVSLDEAEDDNHHIIGPALADDSHVLADMAAYLTNNPMDGRGTKLIRTFPAEPNPVIFTTVQKRPLGLPINTNPSASQCQMIEKLLEPWLWHLVSVYFSRVNICLPLLDEYSFKEQYINAKGRISPALLSSLYVNVLAFWRFDPQLLSQRCPDQRYLWNIANEVLYSELLLSPAISTITAILLNIGGRPSTSMIGNGVQLGSAVSLAQSLGLNRNPSSWNIPESEKYLRMKIWWSLLIFDRWSSLAYGTPPHINAKQYDVPDPTLEYLLTPNSTERDVNAARVFVALSSLTRVLDTFLDQLYRVNKRNNRTFSDLDHILNQWIEGLDSVVRKIIVRGALLEIPGAPNLHLSYLSIKLLLGRLELNADKEDRNSNAATLKYKYAKVRRTAEEIVLLVQDLDEIHLGDFWLPVSAFAFSSTASFLLRSAIEVDNTPGGLLQSPSLGLANDLIIILRSHSEKFGWDLGDICLKQYGEAIGKLMTPPAQVGSGDPVFGLQQPFMPDASFIDELFPSIWDTLQGI